MVSITEAKFSDIYIMSENKKAYIPNKATLNSLIEFNPEDFDTFYNLIINAYDGKNSSYSVNYEGILYRVEKSIGISGVQYCARKMPSQVPSIKALGLPQELVNFLMALRRSSGLILCAGSTGSGKTTTISSDG